MRLDLLSRTITAAVLVALAITLGVWLTHAPLTAASQKIVPEPTLAPPPTPVRPATMPTIIEVPVEVEIAAPATKLAQPESAYPPRRRGLFRRR